jgi:hypothetical protein
MRKKNTTAATKKLAMTGKKPATAKKGGTYLIKKTLKKPAKADDDRWVTWPAQTTRIWRDARTGRLIGSSLASGQSTSTMLDRALKRLADK